MALKLTIIERTARAARTRASIVFGVAGGSIGRAHDNDWVLPDPQRYLSAHHARVQFRRRQLIYLLDTSTNGVFVNGGTRADRPAQHLPAARRRSAAAGRLSDRRQHRRRGAPTRPRRVRSFRSIPSR